MKQASVLEEEKHLLLKAKGTLLHQPALPHAMGTWDTCGGPQWQQCLCLQ